MTFYIVIPAYNEEAYIEQMLQSLVDQSLTPEKAIVVNDGSTDRTQAIVDRFAASHSFISSLTLTSEDRHEPGSKVIAAFEEGYKTLGNSYDVLGKFDADIVLPKNYFQWMKEIFEADPNIGMAGGNLYIQKGNEWVYESISKKNKLRGPIKLYRKECFRAIGGLKKSIGWDTVDGLLARYHKWSVVTDETLRVKHLKPTGKVYSRAALRLQGEAMYKMRYGWLLSTIAIAKLALKKRSVSFFMHSFKGYLSASQNKVQPLVNADEGKFIRRLRWSGIRGKLTT